MSDTRKDVVIIGSGPAGLSAAVYAKRALLDVAVIEKEMLQPTVWISCLASTEQMAMICQ